ncbi:MAG TPA: hypothetical protein VFW00_10380, partial [Rhodocyclaceae bacterium]|nr:hypothetical protein [Rhodocyclaceae bacterium]
PAGGRRAVSVLRPVVVPGGGSGRDGAVVGERDRERTSTAGGAGRVTGGAIDGGGQQLLAGAAA